MRVLVIPDLHLPYHHPDALPWLSRLKRELKPELVVCIGDLLDNHYLSPHGMHEKALSPETELSTRSECLRLLSCLFPYAIACIGNHDKRGSLHMPKWVWKKKHKVKQWVFAHGDSGYFYKPLSSLSYAIGHWHNRGGVVSHSHSYLLNSGCLIDPTSPIFPTVAGLKLGAGFIHTYPEWIPYA